MPHEAQARDNMNRMYRFTRHIYDASRKYYLLGRDVLISRINPNDDEHVCEIGCGTARNLRKMAPRYPNAHFYGIDASDEMLKTACTTLDKLGMLPKVSLAQGYAQSFNPNTLFNTKKPFDKIFFSYALSIIPPWKESIDHALTLIESGSEIHIVDFGDQDKLPQWFSKFLFWWLAKFHVYHKPEILEYLQQLHAEEKGSLKVEHLYRGYAYYAVFSKT